MKVEMSAIQIPEGFLWITSVCLSVCLCVLQVKDVNQIALERATMAWEKKGLWHKLFIQLCRQASNNSNP